MNDIYKFNSLNNLNILSGGLFSNSNVYDIIENAFKKTVDISDTDTPKDYGKTQKKSCEGTKNPSNVILSCESGKLLKYLIRMETMSLEKRKKKDEKQIKREKKIAKKQEKKNKKGKSQESNQDSTPKESSRTNSQLKLESNIIKKDTENNKIYIDVSYLNTIINNIIQFIDSFEEILKSCRIMRTIDMISLSKILLEEYKFDQSGKLIPKSSDEKKAQIKKHQQEEKDKSTSAKLAQGAQKFMDSKANIIRTTSQAITDKKNIKLFLGVAVVFGLIKLAEKFPVAGTVVGAVGASIAVGIIASKVRKFALFGDSIMPKDDYIEKLSMFKKVLENFKTDMNNKIENNNIIYVESFCVTSVDSRCENKETKTHGFSKEDKRFIKGILKYMENVFEAVLSDTKKTDLDGLTAQVEDSENKEN